ncbi:unnamed protein product [Parnassius apollo]|uniref:(apollo) hypothetical protein n=1 Tax=Parnassius apollo TaxID=110799 RepID=A0A8S3XRS2_PARAO|nr:unnamed protein product [Parnassius apollo]
MGSERSSARAQRTGEESAVSRGVRGARGAPGERGARGRAGGGRQQRVARQHAARARGLAPARAPQQRHLHYTATHRAHRHTYQTTMIT